jgi:hypothetical protein
MEYIEYSKRNEYIEDSSPIHKKDVFIITTYITKPHHPTVLKLSVSRIQLYHPDADIIILNDSQSITLEGFDSSVRIESTRYQRCGELNAYVWACEHMNEYNHFIFIHDSVLLISRILFDLEGINFRPLWYGSRCINDDTNSPEIELIISKFRLKKNSISTKIHEIRKGNGSIIFGGMAVFNKKFLEFVVHDTNFMDVAYLFNTRHLRSFFERLLYIILTDFYMISNFHSYSLCGDIFNHESAFRSCSLLQSDLCRNPFALKIWQGR